MSRPAVPEVLEHALAGERISEEEALTLLRSRDLVAVGKAANALRARRTDPDKVTFFVGELQAVGWPPENAVATDAL